MKNQTDKRVYLQYHPLRRDTLLRITVYQYRYSDLNIMAKINFKSMYEKEGYKGNGSYVINDNLKPLHLFHSI